jgi:uncharacterized phage-associated protein
MYNVHQIADWFLSQINTDKGDTISHLKLHKLVYYAQAWHYTIFGKPLFNDRIEAWMNGPVVVALYARLHGVLKHNAIDTQGISKPSLEEHTEELLQDVFSIYGEHSGTYLEELTHSEQPWIDARGGIPAYAKCTNEITIEAMRTYYITKQHGSAQASK